MPDKQTFDVTLIPTEGENLVAPVYCNNADMSISPWDVRIMFAEIIPSGGQVKKHLRASVSMHPGHAKALLAALETTVRQYEETFGEIRMPQAPDLTKGK